MNEAIEVTKLNNNIKILNLELVKSKKKISELEHTLLKLQKEYNELKARYFISSSKEIEYQNMKGNLQEKNDIIADLEKEIIDIKRAYENDKKAFDIKYEHDIKKVQFLNEKLNIRNESSSKFEKLNDLLYHHVLQLENMILNFKKEEKKHLNEQELKFDKKMNKFKKKMLDFIQDGRAFKGEKSKENFKIIQKFSILNHNSLLNELEFGSLQLEDLLKQREHLDKVITQMRTDIDIHRNVEKLLVNKNKKYVDMIRTLSEKIENSGLNKKQNGNDNKKEINNQCCENIKMKEKDILYKKIKKSIENNKKFLERKIDMNHTQRILKIENINNQKMSLTNYKMKLFQRNNSANELEYMNKTDQIISEKIKLQKELIKKTKEIDNLRSSCKYYKEKLKYINDRYTNILNLYDSALERIYQDNNEDLKELYIDINDFKNCDFERLSPDKRYSITILLIKHILPLINENNLPKNIKKKLKNTQTRFYLNETNDSSFRFRSSSSSFFDNFMRENENKLSGIRDGTWDKLNKKRNKNNIRNISN